MKKNIITLSLSIFALGLTTLVVAQEDVDKEVLNWYNGGGTGMQTEKAYKLLKKRDTKTVIVAIIDSGIDIEHEDLQGKIWTNTDEIPGNGIDDDKNGYVDDVHGWNFLGNSNGENAGAMQLERTRILAKLSKKFEGVDEATVSSAEKAEYALYKKVQEEVEEEIANYTRAVGYYSMLIGMIENAPAMSSEAMGKEGATKDEVIAKMKELDKEIAALTKANAKAEDAERSEKIATLQDTYDQLDFVLAVLNGELTVERMSGAVAQFQGMIDTHHNVEFDGRSVIGDDPDDFSDVNYGNNDVEGPDALHGTHVGGIVAAIRGNGKGGDGVANDALLMVLRAVPDGDEYDKDVALAIRYAVDNGASVINMSFGKSYSPHQKEVYEAFAYADSKGVLCIHAAGNDNSDVDVAPNFPTSKYSFQTKKLDHYLTIGSSTKDAVKKVVVPSSEDPSKMKKMKVGALPSPFSNYGQTSVDVFAPGSEIFNAVPQSDYQELQGTSMACPMVSGVAAMLKSYFPEMSMKEIKEVILSTSTSYKGVMQVLPGNSAEDAQVDFAKMSVTGGVVNVYAAVKECLRLEKMKK